MQNDGEDIIQLRPRFVNESGTTNDPQVSPIQRSSPEGPSRSLPVSETSVIETLSYCTRSREVMMRHIQGHIIIEHSDSPKRARVLSEVFEPFMELIFDRQKRGDHSLGVSI